jgi:DNA-binding transcriptional LysR family regulator
MVSFVPRSSLCRRCPPHLARRNPQLQVRSCFTDRFVDLIAEGFDCAIRVGHLTDSNMIARKVGYTPAVYVATPA